MSKGIASKALKLLQNGATRLDEGKLACEWGCRIWIFPEERVEHEKKVTMITVLLQYSTLPKRGYSWCVAVDVFFQVCTRRLSACRLGCGIAIREEQWVQVRQVHEQGKANAVLLRPAPYQLMMFDHPASRLQ